MLGEEDVLRVGTELGNEGGEALGHRGATASGRLYIRTPRSAPGHVDQHDRTTMSPERLGQRRGVADHTVHSGPYGVDDPLLQVDDNKRCLGFIDNQFRFHIHHTSMKHRILFMHSDRGSSVINRILFTGPQERRLVRHDRS